MQQFSVSHITRDVELPDARALRHVREAFDRSVAVVLGVNDYQRGIPRLKTAVPDAQGLAAVLEVQHGFMTLVRRDAEVTGPSVRALLGRDLATQIGGELTERDRLLVYFAGHGVSLPSEHGPEGWLLLADADAADPRSFFAMRELRTLISALPCRHVMVVLDCCFAGTFRWSGSRCDRGVGTQAYRESLERSSAIAPGRSWSRRAMIRPRSTRSRLAVRSLPALRRSARWRRSGTRPRRTRRLPLR